MQLLGKQFGRSAKSRGFCKIDLIDSIETFRIIALCRVLHFLVKHPAKVHLTDSGITRSQISLTSRGFEHLQGRRQESIGFRLGRSVSVVSFSRYVLNSGQYSVHLRRICIGDKNKPPYAVFFCSEGAHSRTSYSSSRIALNKNFLCYDGPVRGVGGIRACSGECDILKE
jgi:hypothetical protein